MKEKELIEKLKDNKVVFGLLSKEEQECFEKVGTENCEYYAGIIDKESLWDKCLPSNFFSKSTYRIKQNYQYEEPLPTYEDICESLFAKKGFYFTMNNGCIAYYSQTKNVKLFSLLNNAPTNEQLEKILYVNKLQNIANYLNDGWKPDFDNNSLKFYIVYSHDIKLYIIYDSYSINSGNVYFKTGELAKKAINIMGKEDLNKAFGIK